MQITPAAPTGQRSQFVASVVSNDSLCREHFGLTLRIAAGFPKTSPGQFIQVACRDIDLLKENESELDWNEGRPLHLTDPEMLSPTTLLRRPFSLAGRSDGEGFTDLRLIHRVVGIGTNWLSRLHPGDSVGILGPLGNRFALPAGEAPALLIGGGVGIPPMIYLAESLAGRKAVVFCGALSRDLLPLTITDDTPANPGQAIEPRFNIAEFSRHRIPDVITTDDGSFGYQGFVTQALEAYLDATKFAAPPILYTCGPELMMKRVADIARSRGLIAQIAVERAMACGMGTCQSCCIRVKEPTPESVGSNPTSRSAEPPEWVYKLACTDGPVFSSDDLLW